MASGDSKQLDIIKELTRVLETINPGAVDPVTNSAYQIDVTGNVLRGLDGIGKEQPLPAVLILESPKPQPGQYAGGEDMVIRKDVLDLLIQGFIPQGSEYNADAAYSFKAVVESVLSQISEIAPGVQSGGKYPDNYMLGKDGAGQYRLIGFTIVGGGVRPPTGSNSPTAFFYLQVQAKFKFDSRNPYAV